MAHGRPDYWSSTILGLPSPMAGQYVFTLLEEGDILPGATADLCSYTNPADRILYLSAVLIHTNSRARNEARVNIDGSWLDHLRFVTLLPLQLHPSAFYELLQGKNIYVRVYNNDIYERNFSVTLIGYQETG